MTPNADKTATPYGRGGIEQLPSGRWRVRLTVDGARVRETCDTLEAAEALRRGLVQARLDRDREKALQPAPKPEAVTLASWGKTWLTRREARVRWFANDKSRWGLYVAPSTLAAMPLADVRTKHIKAWLADVAATVRDGKPLTTRTVRHVLNLVRKALADALEEETIADNPAVGVKIPKRAGAIKSAPMAFLTADEVHSVERCEVIPEALRLLYAVAIYTGLRQGELWGLRWGDVHEDGARPEVVVRWSHKSAPKNGKVQPVPMLPKAREAFAKLRALATVDGEKPAADELVFPSTRGHQRQPFDDAGWSSRKVRSVPRVGHRELAGVNRRVSFHGLRHTCASHLLMGTWGITLTLADVRVFLRHESVETTDQYAHLVPEHLYGRIAVMPAATTRSPAQAPSTVPTHESPSASSAPPAPRSEAPLEAVASSGHVTPSNSGHVEGGNPAETSIFLRRAMLESNQRPWASETHALSS